MSRQGTDAVCVINDNLKFGGKMNAIIVLNCLSHDTVCVFIVRGNVIGPPAPGRVEGHPGERGVLSPGGR